MLPSFARPKWGKKSVFDAEHVKVSVASVLTGFATFAVIFASVNQARSHLLQWFPCDSIGAVNADP